MKTSFSFYWYYMPWNPRIPQTRRPVLCTWSDPGPWWTSSHSNRPTSHPPRRITRIGWLTMRTLAFMDRFKGRSEPETIDFLNKYGVFRFQCSLQHLQPINCQLPAGSWWENRWNMTTWWATIGIWMALLGAPIFETGRAFLSIWRPLHFSTIQDRILMALAPNYCCSTTRKKKLPNRAGKFPYVVDSCRKNI